MLNNEKATATKVVSVRRVFHACEHNAFKDLCRFRGQLWLVLRSCPDGHMVQPTASVIVLRSADGVKWEEAHRFRVERRDIRDPQFLVFQDRLFVFTGSWYSGATTPAPADYDLNQHLDFAAWSGDGVTWHSPTMLEGTFGHYIWRAAALGERLICVAGARRGSRSRREVKANRSSRSCSKATTGWCGASGRHFSRPPGMKRRFYSRQKAVFLGLGRRGGNAQLLLSKPPYMHWDRSDLDRSIAGPLLLILN